MHARIQELLEGSDGRAKVGVWGAERYVQHMAGTNSEKSRF
jgi:hypothetical protein